MGSEKGRSVTLVCALLILRVPINTLWSQPWPSAQSQVTAFLIAAA